MIEQQSANWKGVPEDMEEKWMQIFSDSREGINLSSPCPVCASRTLHKFYLVGEKIDYFSGGKHFIARGALWEWCSTCHSYEHYSALVPDYWSCDLHVNTDELTAIPDVLERAVQESLG